jgi:predicted DNA-binding transcriptional regulator AlpA
MVLRLLNTVPTGGFTQSNTRGFEPWLRTEREQAMTMRLPIEAVCVMVGMSRPTLFRAIAAGSFPRGVQYGRRVLWDAAVVEDWLNRERRDGSTKLVGRELRASLANELQMG